jgi:hypothetical protein
LSPFRLRSLELPIWVVPALVAALSVLLIAPGFDMFWEKPFGMHGYPGGLIAIDAARRLFGTLSIRLYVQLS